MDNDDFDQRLRRIEAATAVIKDLPDPELRLAALQYVLGAAPTAGASGSVGGTADVGTQSPVGDAGTSGRAKGRPARLRAKKPDTPDGTSEAGTPPVRKRPNTKKQSFTLDRDLNFRSTNGTTKTSFVDLAEKLKPRSVIDKVTIAVYWLQRELEIDPVTIDQVYSAFKAMAWPVPADLVNTVQQAGSKGYLDSGDRNAIKLVVGGENLIEHDMPGRQTA